ncbi:MAG: DUF192 domain-containing protein [Bdellovibrionales bacterium]|nr:DUF192 domain-containing protein [Bdellovibrionales bacterium]
MPSLVNESQNQIIFSNLIVAESFWDRSKGLLGRDSLDQKSAMWILRCNWIHTFFMQFPIDVIYVNRQLVVQKIKKYVRPGRLTLPVWQAHSVFEIAAGQAEKANIKVGDQLYVGN